MRKAVLVVITMLAAARAEAQDLGCFVERSNPSQCSEAHLTCTDVPALNVSAFGISVGTLCNEKIDDLAALDFATQQYNELAKDYAGVYGQWQACGDTVKQINGAIGYWEGLANYWNSLYAQQLNRANAAIARCGKKCRGM